MNTQIEHFTPYSEDENHQKMLVILRAWSKRKEDRQRQVREDYKAGKYDEFIKRLDEEKKNSNV